ncbi:MAG: phosphate ABC transporter permease subunit PstC [Bdellovibrionales bacterium]|nr:phosphate ABC transporter permease subunit PstC [Bdellovibrionales bacterium]
MIKFKSKTQDAILFYVLRAISILVIAVLIGIIYVLAKSAWPAIKSNGFMFLFKKDWNPVEDQYGALPFIFGTVVTSLIALLIATPVSILIAIFITEYLPRSISKFISLLVEMVAAIPSIVFGLWGIFYLAPFVKNELAPFLKLHLGFLPFFQGPSFGIGILTAALILSIMIVPTISSICRSIFELIPDHQKEASYALGSTKYEMIKLAVISPSVSGITSAVVLGLGRALGETMAVTMLIGNSPVISTSIFSPAATMASVMANEYADANTPMHVASLCYLALLLFLITFLSNLFARTIVKSFRKG